MRLIQTIALTGLTLLFAASSANAWQVRMESSSAGGQIGVGDTVTVTVDFNTDGSTDLLALGVGLIFDNEFFTYDQGASSNTTYLLYSNSKTAWLEPASTCGGNSGSGCNLYLTNPNQVQLDFLSTKVAQGPTGGIPNASTGFENLSTLVFTATKEGTTGFSFLFDPVFGGALGLADGQQPNLELGEGFSVVVPEPGLALMSIAALGTIALVRRNRR